MWKMKSCNKNISSKAKNTKIMDTIKQSKMPDTLAVKGQCMQMCPQEEVIMREKECLLHVLEMVPGTEKHKKPQSDRTKMVKSFSRSAAGKQLQNPKNLRPPSVLLETIHYLFDKVLVNKRVPWHITYDFLMDRLRCVRQDMIVQNASVAESICILQPIVRFYAYAAYWLCEQPIANFDAHINETHLQECLKRLLCLYDECDQLFSNEITKESYCMKQLENTRPEFEALYLTLNLGSTIALMRGLSLPLKLRQKEVVKIAMSLSMDYCRNNFVSVCYKFAKLTVLLQGVVAAIHLPDIRRKALNIMSVAFHCKNSAFPLVLLKELLLYNDLNETVNDCQYYGLKCDTTTTNVQFIKTNFDKSKNKVHATHLKSVDEEFGKVQIGDLILNG